jgi:hypothetical protein
MAPLRRPYPSVGEPESVPLQTYYEYEYPSSSYTYPLPTSSAPTPHLNTLQLQSPRQRLKRSHTYKDQSNSTRFSSSISQPATTMSQSTKAHSNKSHSLPSTPSRQRAAQRVVETATADDSLLARIMPRPKPTKSTTTTPVHTRRSSRSPSAKSDFDGLPRAARSVSLQPTSRPRPPKITTGNAPTASNPTSTDTTNSTTLQTSDTRHLRYETLEFTPEHERFPYIIRPRSATGDCPDMSRSSSIISLNRSSLFTPSGSRPNTDVISYFPPYVGSETYDEDEEDEVEVVPEGNRHREGRESNHSRGSSLSAFASAIISVFRLSPKKNTIPLPDPADAKPDEPQPDVKPKGPIKLVPIPTAEWPCGSIRDKRRRDNIEEDGENMMLYPVKREGSRNKDASGSVDAEAQDENVEREESVEEKVRYRPTTFIPKLTPQPTETRSKLLVDLSLQPQHPHESRHPMQSPPEIGVSSRSAFADENAFQYSEYETLEEVTPSPTRAPSPTLQERMEVTKAKINKLKIKLAKESIKSHRSIDPAHIPTEHRSHSRSRTRSRTRDEEYTESSSMPSSRPSVPPSREEYYGVSRSSSRSSSSRSRDKDQSEPFRLSSRSSSSRSRDKDQGEPSRPSSRSSSTRSRDKDQSEPSRPSSGSSSRSQTRSITPSQTYSDYLFPQESSMPPPRRPSSPTPSLSSVVTPTPSESGADDMDDPEETPKAGRGGWVALHDVM